MEDCDHVILAFVITKDHMMDIINYLLQTLEGNFQIFREKVDMILKPETQKEKIIKEMGNPTLTFQSGPSFSPKAPQSSLLKSSIMLDHDCLCTHLIYFDLSSKRPGSHLSCLSLYPQQTEQ